MKRAAKIDSRSIGTIKYRCEVSLGLVCHRGIGIRLARRGRHERRGGDLNHCIEALFFGEGKHGLLSITQRSRPAIRRNTYSLEWC